MKQWAQWKTVSWVAALMVIATMLVPVLNAWLPTPLVTAEGMRVWQTITVVESIVMMGYAGLAMWQVGRWIGEARDANNSNPDDFPADYARRVWLAPVIFTPVLWPAFICDSPLLMAVQNVLLSVSNIVLLLIVTPVWRRKAILASPEADTAVETDTPSAGDNHTNQEELIDQTAVEIEAYVRDQRAFLNPHLKIDDVVSYTQLGRTYVSHTFSQRFGSFANYVNSLRLAHYEQYLADHPNETKEAAAIASGFSSYTACYRAKQKLKTRPEVNSANDPGAR